MYKIYVHKHYVYTCTLSHTFVVQLIWYNGHVYFVFLVCIPDTGNICRSPIAEAVFRKLVNDRGLNDKVSNVL